MNRAWKHNKILNTYSKPSRNANHEEYCSQWPCELQYVPQAIILVSQPVGQWWLDSIFQATAGVTEQEHSSSIDHSSTCCHVHWGEELSLQDTVKDRITTKWRIIIQCMILMVRIQICQWRICPRWDGRWCKCRWRVRWSVRTSEGTRADQLAGLAGFRQF